MNQTKGAILYDGGPWNNTHYTSTIASYCAQSEGVTELRSRLAAISISQIIYEVQKDSNQYFQDSHDAINCLCIVECKMK